LEHAKRVARRANAWSHAGNRLIRTPRWVPSWSDRKRSLGTTLASQSKGAPHHTAAPFSRWQRPPQRGPEVQGCSPAPR
jgi:hypothetical protein